MTHRPPTPLQTVRALALGYLPRLLQARGFVLCALAVLPVGLPLLARAFHGHGDGLDARAALNLFHGVMASVAMPVMALVAAPAGVREDLEQRTLPLLLVRPAPAWAFPLGKGLAWFAWGALWLSFACLGLLFMEVGPAQAALLALALAAAFWGQLALVTLLGLLFKRGTLWGALVLFGWEALLRVFPPALQRLTFLHHLESIAGSRGGEVAPIQIMAQGQVATPPWLSLLLLLGFGLLCWTLAGLKVQMTPVGLAGREGEG